MIAALILLPLAGCVSVKLCARKSERAAGFALSASCLAQLVLSVCLLLNAYNGREAVLSLKDFCGMNVSFRADGFRSLYVCVAAFMWFETSLLCPRYFRGHHRNERYYFFNLLTLTGVTGMFLSDDLFCAFIFFEIMSMASYPWVAQEETPGAMRAAATYLGIAVLGGMVTLMGMLLLQRNVGSLRFEDVRNAFSSGKNALPGALILFGFLAKAGAFPLHIWLPKAHPVAPAPASALLSGLLTKAGIFGVLVVSFGIFRDDYVYGCVLLGIALTTMLLGAVLGVFSVDLKRTLACSSMSQIGYILTGVASSVLLKEEGALPLVGAFGHMLNHSVLKLVLFMTAGAIYMNAHSLDLNKLRGYGRKKPLLHVCYLLGALGLSGVPLFNGYLSKTMIHEGLAEWVRESGSFAFRLCEWVFLFAAGLTAAYMLKTYVCIFIEKNADGELQKKYDSEGRSCLNVPSRFALITSALLIPAFGLLTRFLPKTIARLCLPFAGVTGFEEIDFFSFENLKGGAISLLIGVLVYLLVVRKWMLDARRGYVDRKPAFDLEDDVYRPFFCKLLPEALAFLMKLLNPVGDAAAKAFSSLLLLLSRLLGGATDWLALIVHEAVFVDHGADTRGKTQGAAMTVRDRAAHAQSALDRLKPEMPPDPREVTDLRYGSFFTNTITFGLIVATLGIVAALVYILIKHA